MKVFVYGTLRSGYGNNVLLHNATFLGEATTNGTMYSMGYIPFVSLKSRDTVVHGEVYEINEDILRNLDRLEGYNARMPEHSFYNRSLVETSPYGEAFIYHIDSREAEHNKIPSGDWRVYLEERKTVR